MFSWIFSSKKEHSASWYIAAIVVVLTLVTYGITQGLYLMSIVSFLFAGVYILMENNSSPSTIVEIDQNSVKVGNSYYEMKSLEKFAIIRKENTPLYLRLSPRKKLSPVISIPLTTEVDIEGLRDFLASLIEEDKDAVLTNSDALIHAMRL